MSLATICKGGVQHFELFDIRTFCQCRVSFFYSRTTFGFVNGFFKNTTKSWKRKDLMASGRSRKPPIFSQDLIWLGLDLNGHIIFSHVYMYLFKKNNPMIIYNIDRSNRQWWSWESKHRRYLVKRYVKREGLYTGMSNQAKPPVRPFLIKLVWMSKEQDNFQHGLHVAHLEQTELTKSRVQTLSSVQAFISSKVPTGS